MANDQAQPENVEKAPVSARDSGSPLQVRQPARPADPRPPANVHAAPGDSSSSNCRRRGPTRQAPCARSTQALAKSFAPEIDTSALVSPIAPGCARRGPGTAARDN